MTSLYLKTSVLVRPRENDNPAFLKNPTLGNVFKHLHFGARNLCLRLDGKLERRKISVTVRNIRIRVEGAYREPSPLAREKLTKGCPSFGPPHTSFAAAILRCKGIQIEIWLSVLLGEKWIYLPSLLADKGSKLLKVRTSGDLARYAQDEQGQLS